MFKIAIIQFPGLNTEYETRREINRAGMRGEFFRWNSDHKKLPQYDGYVIGGGFSYEDRGRAGIIASLDPIMNTIKKEAGKGKPVLGICNGAQILVEAGLIPGADGNKLALALARNRRIKDGQILGTGYYNAWTHIKCTVPHGGCMFTWNMGEGEILQAPVAHGEGRFTTEIEGLMKALFERGQIALRYCNSGGVIIDEFPVNPNGAQFNTAAICNPAGNVMAVMPHLERNAIASLKLFESMRDALAARKHGNSVKRGRHLQIKPLNLWPIRQYKAPDKSFNLLVSLKITDNEADTFEMTLQRIGFPKITLRRYTHYEISYIGKQNIEALSKKLINCGVLLNTNKELAQIGLDNGAVNENMRIVRLLVREKPNLVGGAKLSTLTNRLKYSELTGLTSGVLWEISIPTKSAKVADSEFKRIIETHMLFNPHGQEAFVL